MHKHKQPRGEDEEENKTVNEKHSVNKQKANYKECHSETDDLRKSSPSFHKSYLVCITKSFSLLLLISNLMYQNNIIPTPCPDADMPLSTNHFPKN